MPVVSGSIPGTIDGTCENQPRVLDVRRLQILLAVAEHGSFSSAARALDYTQPAVSHHVARLEEEVGLALFTRAGRGVRLTEAGEALCFHARDVIARLGLAEQ